MENFKASLDEINRLFQIADHLVFATYPAVKELKLLISASENLYKAVMKGIEIVVEYDRMYKRVPLVKGDINSELRIFKDSCLKRYSFDPSVLLLIKDLRLLIESREKSAMEFRRKDKFVICSPSYRMNIINFHKVKLFMSQGRMFIEKLNKVVR